MYMKPCTCTLLSRFMVDFFFFNIT
uniref:Uncharacterized protein n=1 Tax=Arundo donax TaxID=35708 RepID=A0A0A8ZYX5_ARUDO